MRHRRQQLAAVWAAHAGLNHESTTNRLRCATTEIEATAVCLGPLWRELSAADRRARETPFWLPVDDADGHRLRPAMISPPPSAQPGEAEEKFWGATKTIGQVRNFIQVLFGEQSLAANLDRLDESQPA